MRILAFDAGGTYIKSALFDDRKGREDLESEPSQRQTMEERVNAIAALASARSDYDAIGVAITGQIDTRTQCQLFSYGRNTEESAFPVGDIIRRATKKPVFVLNDANAAALGEARAGAGVGRPDFLCLTYGTGVGGAIIQNGRLTAGSRGIAGEFGHMVIHAGGRLCGCGHRGCYERYASTTALVNAARKVEPGINSGRDLFQRLPENPALRPVLRRWVNEICEGLSTLAYIFDPPCIILGGGIMEQESLVEMIRARMRRRLIPTYAGVEILHAALGNGAGLYGAMEYAKERMTEGVKP